MLLCMSVGFERPVSVHFLFLNSSLTSQVSSVILESKGLGNVVSMNFLFLNNNSLTSE